MMKKNIIKNASIPHADEIIEQEEKTCTIKNLTKELSVNTEELIKKISIIINLEFLIVSH